VKNVDPTLMTLECPAQTDKHGIRLLDLTPAHRKPTVEQLQQHLNHTYIKKTIIGIGVFYMRNDYLTRSDVMGNDHWKRSDFVNKGDSL
jgi:hypothetical protein